MYDKLSKVCLRTFLPALIEHIVITRWRLSQFINIYGASTVDTR